MDGDLSGGHLWTPICRAAIYGRGSVGRLKRIRKTEIPYPGAGSPATRARCRMPATGPVIRRAEIFRFFFFRPGQPGPVLWLFLIE